MPGLESAGFYRILHLSRGYAVLSFFFFHPAASGPLRSLFALRLSARATAGGLFARAKSALCMDDWVRWQRLSEVIICRVDGERQCKMVRLSPFCCFSTIFLSPSYPCLAVPFGPGSQLMFTCRLLQLLTRFRYFSSHFTPNSTERSSRIPFSRSTTAGHFATLL